MLRTLLKERFESGIVEDQIFKPIDCINERYKMNQSGLIYDGHFDRIKLPIKNNNHYYYTFPGREKELVIAFDKAYLMCHSPMNCTLEEYINVLKVHYWDKNIKLPNLDSLTWLIPKGGIESRIKKGFYSVVGMPEILVNKSGEVYNIKTGRIHKPSSGSKKDWYPVTAISRTIDSTPLFTTLTHRVMALAFLPIEGNKKHFFVNHKDGNKRNFSVENLEWTNHYKNNQHAIESGLRTDSLKAHAINMITGEVKYFPSLGSVAKEFGTVTGNVTHAIKQYNNDKYIKFKPWLVLPINQKLPKADPKALEYITLHEDIYYKVVVDGKDHWFKGSNSFPKDINLSRAYLAKYPKRITNESMNGYTVSSYTKYELDDDIIESLHVPSKRGGSDPIPIKVEDLDTGQVMFYSSSDEFARLLNKKKKSIQRIVNYNNGRYRNFQITYLNTKFHGSHPIQ